MFAHSWLWILTPSWPAAVMVLIIVASGVAWRIRCKRRKT